MAALASAGLLLIAIASCASAPTPAPSSATPTPTPVFASDEEALAAATEAYANYLSTYDASWADGDGSMQDFLKLSVGEANENDRSSYSEWKANDWHPVGKTTFDSIEIQSSTQTESGFWEIRTYLCLDASDGDVVDVNGISVARPDRPLRVPLEVAFLSTSAASVELKISESRVWSGKNFC